MASKKVAVVTGSNKGIGYAIVKGLCQKFNGSVYLTAREEGRGLAAVESLNKSGFYPKFHTLDVTVEESIYKLKDHLLREYGGLDLLVNNAAISFKKVAEEPFSYQAIETIRVNYFGLKSVCEILFPILRSHARVVNVTSAAGRLFRIPGEDWRERFASKTLTESELSDLMKTFVDSAQRGANEAEGWGNSAYVVSKVGVSALTQIQQKELLNDKREDIVVNSVHPGFVDTDMTSHQGHLTIEEGAEAPLYAALLPPNITEPKGAYIWEDKQTRDWAEIILKQKKVS